MDLRLCVEAGVHDTSVARIPSSSEPSSRGFSKTMNAAKSYVYAVVKACDRPASPTISCWSERRGCHTRRRPGSAARR